MSFKPLSIKTLSKSNYSNTNAYAPPATWTAPSGWLTLPIPTGANQCFTGLKAVWNTDCEFLALSANTSSGTYTVNWGDGSANQTYTSGTNAQYQYTYSSLNAANLTTYGYNQVIVDVFPTTPGANLTGINLNIKYANASLGTIPAYENGWLSIGVNSNNSLSSFTITGTAPVITSFLLQSVVIGAHALKGGAYFNNLISLQNISISDTSLFTTMVNLFANCKSLAYGPWMVTGNVTNMTNMFLNCYSLEEVPAYNTSAVTNMQTMFDGCESLKYVPYLNTSLVTNMQSMFQSCISLQNIPPYITGNVTNMTQLFYDCYSLQSIPQMNTAAVTIMSGMLFQCYSLQSIPQFITGNVTAMGQMFYNCSSLQTIPQMNTVSVANMQSMFQGTSLQTIPQMTTDNVTNMTQMFDGCTSLQSIPQMNTASVTTMLNMFLGCGSLQTIPQMNTAAVTNMAAMFDNCYALQSIPQMNTAAVTNTQSMFTGCSVLNSVPNLQFGNVGTGNFALIFSTCPSLTNCQAVGIAQTISITGCKFGNTDITNFIGNLVSNSAATLTITNNPGAPAAFTQTGNTVAGNNTVKMGTTTNFVAGMEVFGTGIFDGVAVTFFSNTTYQQVNTAVSYNLVSNTLVSFSVITTTAGLALNTPYYVVNAHSNTFQISLTPSGSPIAFTTNGSGTMFYQNFITTVNPSANIILTNGASSTQTTTTISAAWLQRSPAKLKGWTVTG